MKKCLHWLDRYAEIAVIAFAIIVIVIIMTAQVIMRRVVGNALSWTEELARYLFIYIGFLSVSLTLRNESAIRIDMVMNLFPATVQKIVKILVQSILLVFFVYVTKVSIDIFQTMTQTSPTLRISMKWVYLAEVIGFALAVIRLFQNLWDLLRSKKGSSHP